MPIYGYLCQACGHTLDALQKIADEPLTDCPECGESTLKRQLSAPRFRLKGQGWYETDFKKDNQRNLAGEGDKAKADAKPDAKPDAKADAKPDAAAATTAGEKTAKAKPAETKPAKAAGSKPDAG